MKRQQKLSSLFTQKRMAVEHEKHEDELDKDGEAGEVSSRTLRANRLKLKKESKL